MKKNTLIIASAIIAAAFALCSCKDDDNSEFINSLYGSSIQVTDASLYFEAVGGKGSVDFESSSAVTATTESPWCHLTVSGNRVDITVDETVAIESRNARIVLKNAQDSVIVAAIQQGLSVDIQLPKILTVNDQDTLLSFLAKSNVSIHVSSNADWLNPDVSGDSLRISVASNPSGKPRRGWVYCTCGKQKDSVMILQFSPSKFFPGDYTLTGRKLLGSNIDEPIELSASIEYVGSGDEDFGIKSNHNTLPVEKFRLTLKDVKQGKYQFDIQTLLYYSPDGGWISFVGNRQVENQVSIKLKSKTYYMYSDFFASSRRKSRTTFMGAMPMPKFGNFGFYVAPIGFDESGRLCLQFENSKLQQALGGTVDIDGWCASFWSSKSAFVSSTFYTVYTSIVDIKLTKTSE